MTEVQIFKKRHNEIKSKLATIKLPSNGTSTQLCWNIGAPFNVSGTTVKNYVSGKVKDGYLAESIYQEFKRLKYCK